MAQEDVAALLNNMAPDDRTMFLEELPAAATRQLLDAPHAGRARRRVHAARLSRESIGRLMTPDYVAVREHWTVREVLDYIRDARAGQRNAERDLRRRRAGPAHRRHPHSRAPARARSTSEVADLMDRRFVALKATDDQEAAVRRSGSTTESRCPVTDTAGMLIGIVTIDDVLDVAEAAATEEIQRIGGSEALDEPYMQIAFGAHDSEARRLADGAVPRRNADGDGDGRVRGGDSRRPSSWRCSCRSSSRAAATPARRPRRSSSARWRWARCGLRDWWRVIAPGDLRRPRARQHPRHHRLLPHHHLVGVLRHLRPALAAVAITVGLALVGVVLWGTLIGIAAAVHPAPLGFDPATSSAPFVATLVDVTGLVIYFSVALVVLRGTLL